MENIINEDLIGFWGIAMIVYLILALFGALLGAAVGIVYVFVGLGIVSCVAMLASMFNEK